MMTKLIAGWLLVICIILFVVRWYWWEQTEQATSTSAKFSVKGTSGDESLVNLHKALTPCCEILGGFLNARSPEERNQFVSNPVEMAGRMARFYDLNPLTRIDPKSVTNTVNTLLDLPTGQGVESRWTTADGRTLDCVFFKQKGEWRLDWEHFARYSEYPWSLFLAGDGPPEAEFRLLVRERLAKERSEASHMSLVFYAPRFGYPELAGLTSPEFLVRRDSDDGKLFTAIFRKQEKGEALYGSKLAYLEPENMTRVRVKIRRLPATTASTQKFELVKVLACHWISINDAGVVPLLATPQGGAATPPPPNN